MVGHSYYGESRAILADIFSLLKTGMPPDKRFGLQAARFRRPEILDFAALTL